MANGDEREQRVPRFPIPELLGGNEQGGLDPIPLDPSTGVGPPTVGEQDLAAPLAASLTTEGQRTAPGGPKPGKGGAAKEVGSVEVEGFPAPDPALEQAQVAYRGADAQLFAAQNQARAISLGIESNLQESLAHGLEENFEKTMGKVDRLLTDAETELAAVDELIEGARSNRINPGQFFANVGEAGTFAAAIAVGTGAMATAFAGGENVAYDVISRAIDRNVRAQALNQQHDRAMISHQLNYVNAIRGLAGDQANIGNITRAALTGIVQAQIEQSRAASGSQIYALNAERVLAQFGADMVEAAIQARQNIKFKYQMKFHSEAQADRRTAVAQAALKNALARATGEQEVQQKAALPPSASARPGAAIERAPVQRPEQTSDAPIRAVQVAEQNPDFANMDARGQAKLIARNYQEAAAVGRDTGDVPTQEEIDAIWKAIDPTGQSPVANELRKLPDTDFTPVRGSSSVAINVPGSGTRHLRVRNEAEWKDMAQSERAQIVDEMTSSIAAEAMATELRRMVGEFSRGKGILGDLMRRGPDEELIFPLFASGSDSEAIAKLDLVGRQLANLKRLEKGSDAVRNVSEWELWEKLATGEVTTRQQIVDIMRGDPEVRKKRIEPFIEFERQNVLRLGTPHFTNFD
jgi:hypothetical protein